MSLFRQIWLAVITATLLAFAGSFVASMLTARTYLEQQLATKNNDNAATLALSMSQQSKDPVTVELQLAAVFDSGQYATVRLIDPEGKTQIERSSPPMAGDVPEWFVRIFPISSRPGSAQVTDGWSQFGSIELISHSHFAYEELWRGGMQLLAWFLIGGTLLGILGMRFLGRIKRPLDAVVGQAKAISERRFVSIEEPAVPELKSVANAMNAMVQRVKAMFDEEAQRLEQVRREATLDALTGLANRSYFMNQLDKALHADDAVADGSLLILRIADLAGINRHAGRETADAVLRRIGAAIAQIDDDSQMFTGARLNGADFALLMPGLDDPSPYAELLLRELRELVAAGLIEQEGVGHIATLTYTHGQTISQLLAQLDVTLASAEQQSKLCWCKAEAECSSTPTSNADWKRLLESAIRTQRLRLIEFPVAANDGQLIHLECPLRLQADENGEWLAAGRFMPMASRLAMTSDLDLAAARLALQRLKREAGSVAVNLSGESILNPAFITQLTALIQDNKDNANRLWLEVSEIGAFQHFDAFRSFCLALRPFGCRLGIEHFGRQFSEIGKLHDIGLDYLKVDSSFIRAIDQTPGNQAFLKGLCSIAHGIGLTVIAEGVQSTPELQVLPELGFDGATGPGVGPPPPKWGAGIPMNRSTTACGTNA